jgi:ribonuclease-3
MALTKDEKKKIKALERKIGYSFKKRCYLKRALTHKSYSNEQNLPSTEHNERYEYLGDAVLELSVSHMLMEEFPSHPEGELSKMRAAIVNESKLADMARGIKLGEFLYLGKGEDRTGGRDKPSILSDAYEAVLGAVYLDRGFVRADRMVRRHFKDVIIETGDVGFVKDYKTRLQEESQGRFRTVPKYRLSSQSGPDHAKKFVIHLYINDELYGVGEGMSKKAAEQDAARQALERLS